ncbi:MAG: cysteine methyltransferase [Cytophagaceae bacterium]|nr:cysteine methyltransferase [Cytophagaceae bacterium]|tara:strand:- start:901 stop:1383 length:483 start_codon:yes stop_codon:yes gene_type:complete
MKTNDKAIIDSPLGQILLEGDKDGLSIVKFLEEEHEITQKIPQSLAFAERQLKAYFAGEHKDFDLRLNPEGTGFQQRVWKKLQDIPSGKTTTYMEMAKQLGDPKVIRAAASANGKNPIAIIIPCHRVIGSDNSLTGYAGGLWRKKWLLEHEQPVKQTSLF